MTSPAERYAAARLRHAESKSVLADFRRRHDFELDDFQLDACRALESGRSVLVAAPTGAGKTVVGEFAVHLARHLGKKAFYTTPIKALSNQKFHELAAVHGADQVGLLTGDVSINGEAPIVVMTTEVLRNMLYVGSSTLLGLAHVVMDEVHYLADRARGAVWEEVILRLPESVAITSLSATVSNAEEFGAWLGQVRGDTTVIVEEHRPVPLWQLVAAEDKLHDLFIDEDQRTVNPELIRLARMQENQLRHARRERRGRGAAHSRYTPFRDQLIRNLNRSDLLPAIWFIFSRKGCDQAVEHCSHLGMKLTTPLEQRQIREHAEAAVADLPAADLAALEVDRWLSALEAGIAAHHAGLLPRFKEVVEQLFQQGLLKVVFATETLALGINMPARSVVIEKLSKWNGDTHVDLSPGEYTQLTGRAGRRGIDDEGNAIVLWQADLDPLSLAGLASTRTYPLKSSFRPGYTMAVNTVENIGFGRTLELIGRSFAQFQADGSVSGLQTQVDRQSEAMAGYLEAMTCHLGDFKEYAALREELGRVEKEAAAAGRLALRAAGEASLAELKVGDIVLIASGRRAGAAVVVATEPVFGESPRVTVVTAGKEVRRVGAADFGGEVRPVGRLRVPAGFDPRSAKARSTLANQLRQQDLGSTPRRARAKPSAVAEGRIAELRLQMRQHPCHGCSDREEHARWSERFFRLQRERESLQGQVAQRTNVLARDFQRVAEVLAELGYLSSSDASAKVTERGNLLRGIHAEAELLIAECIERDLLAGLEPAELAAVVSGFVYQPRREEQDGAPRLPRGRTPGVVEEVMSVYAELVEVEARHRLRTLRKPDFGFAWAVYQWCLGQPLARVLAGAEMSAGDFVRTSRRLLDVLEQIAATTQGESGRSARAAGELIGRGIVDTGDFAD